MNQRKYVFISCGKPLNKLQYFNKDLNEFLTSGKIIKLQRPNLKAREIFIKKRLNYDEDVIEYIARNFYNKPKIWTKNSKNSEFAVL